MGLLISYGVLASVLATLGCLIGAPRRPTGRPRRGVPHRWPVRALMPMVPVALAGILLAPFADLSAVATAGAALWLATLPLLRVTRRWSGWAHAAWSLTVGGGIGYLAAMAWWTVTSGLSGAALAGAVLLWVLEALSLVLVLAYGWEVFDVLGSRLWQRRLAPGSTAVSPTRPDLPFVSIHVLSHNEPPDVLLDTLRSLENLDYPAFEVLVVDRDTTDDDLVRPVEAFCAERSEVFRFHRLPDGAALEAGALNYAEAHSDYRASVIAVVDADYRVEPDWLLETVGAFDDPEVGFVQTPQEYRDWQDVPYLRRLHLSHAYFFGVSQPSRDERNAAVFAGTMGLVRREALLDVGGWDEWCVTEDAELSLRLLEAGWSGHHVDRPFGQGIMPMTFEALKARRFRRCFGGMQILRRHWRLLMPWSHGSRLTQRQRLAHLAGAGQWMGDLLATLFSVVLIASLVDVALGGGLVVRRLGGLLIVALPALLAFGLLRSVAVVRLVRDGAGWRDALGAFGIWMSLGWVVSLACVRGLVEPVGAFLRVPEAREELSWAEAVRSNRMEVGLAGIGGIAVLLALLLNPGWVALGLSLLLAVPVIGWLAAPVNTVAALQADLPPALRLRRDTEGARAGWWSTRGPVRVTPATGIAAALGAILVVVLVQPTSGQSPSSNAVPPLREPSTASSRPSTATTTTETTSSTTSTSSSTAPTSTTPTSTTAPTSTSPSTTAPTTTVVPTQPPSATSEVPTASTSKSKPRGRPTSPPGKPTTR